MRDKSKEIMNKTKEQKEKEQEGELKYPQYKIEGRFVAKRIAR